LKAKRVEVWQIAFLQQDALPATESCGGRAAVP
jgi:hypothetical protein